MISSIAHTVTVIASIAFLVALFFAGALPIPIGYDRGKIKWLMWCGTGMHLHLVYWHGENDGYREYRGFQDIHPEDCSND